MTTLSILGVNLIVVLVLMTALWITSLILRDASIADIFWGCGFAVLAWTSWLAGESTGESLPVIPLLVSLWGVRLSAYLWLRRRGRSEDFRYAAMRQRHGARFALVSLFSVFWLQGLLMWIVAWPIQASPITASSWNVVRSLGLLLTTTGLVIEAIADFQMWRFKSAPANKGRIMNRGLWYYSRHPNYFGDSLMWWGIYLVSANAGTWWWTWIGPALMTYLLIRVSGVRLLDDALQDRLPEYREYIRNTSSFIPLPKRPTHQ